MNILAVDPSVRNIGWALHDTSEGKWEGGTISFNRGPILDTCQILAAKLQSIIRNIPRLDVMITEQPVFFGSAKGRIAAMKGFTLDLAFVNGYLIAHFRSQHRGLRVKQFRPADWKGMVHKKATEAKYIRTFPDRRLPSEHEIDATMMLYHYIQTR